MATTTKRQKLSQLSWAVTPLQPESRDSKGGLYVRCKSRSRHDSTLLLLDTYCDEYLVLKLTPLQHQRPILVGQLSVYRPINSLTGHETISFHVKRHKTPVKASP